MLPQERPVGDLERPDGLLKGGLEGAVDGHHLAGGLHLRPDGAVACGELVEGPPRNLDDAVVEGRLEGGLGPLRDGVGYLVQPFADGDLCGDAGYRVAGGLAGQGGAAADAWIDLDDVVRAVGRAGFKPAPTRRFEPAGTRRFGPAGTRCFEPAPTRLASRLQRLAHDVAGLQRELDVAPALDAERADDLQAGGAQRLVLLVRERLAGGDDDAVAGVDAHRVDVLHVADGDAVVGAVAHHLVLDLLPADQGLLEQRLADGARRDAAGHDLPELLFGVGDAAAGPAEGVGRPDDHGQPDLRDGRDRFLDGADRDVGRERLADVGHELAEQLAVLGAADGRQGSAEQADVVAVEDSGVGQVDGEVEPGLPAQRRQYPVRALGLYDALQDGDGERLDVDDVRYVLVGHDGGGVRVDEHGRDALLAEGLARLRAGVVELGRLPDDDRPGADDEDLGGAVGHHTISSRSVSDATSKSGL